MSVVLASSLMATLVGAPDLGRVVTDKGDERWLGIPGIERSSGGTLWVSAFSGGAKEPDVDNRVLVVTSTDEGATWSDWRILADPPDATRAYDPTLWIDPSGRLWLIYNQGNKETATHEVWARVCDHPDSPDAPFSEPRRLPFDVPYAFRMNKPIVTSWGEWVLPVTWADQVVHDWFAGDDQLQGVAISSDEGATWEMHGAVKAPPWALECMVVELRDGSLRMLIRGGGGRIHESLSTDKGRTWSPSRPTDIPNPCSRFFIRRLASGRLLLLNSPVPDSRTSIVAQLSDDDGAAWSEPLVLDARPGVSYPDACQAADGRIFAVHDFDRGGAGAVVLSVFTEGDVLSRTP